MSSSRPASDPQALWRYRQLEAHSKSARLHLAMGQAGTWVLPSRHVRSRRSLPHRYGRGVPARRWNVGARSGLRLGWCRTGEATRSFRSLVVVSVGVLVAVLADHRRLDPIPKRPSRSSPSGSARSWRRPSGLGPAILHASSSRLRSTRLRLPAGDPDGAGQRDEAGRGGAPWHRARVRQPDRRAPDRTPPPCEGRFGSVMPADRAREARAIRVRWTRVAARRTTPAAVRAGQAPEAARAAVEAAAGRAAAAEGEAAASPLMAFPDIASTSVGTIDGPC